MNELPETAELQAFARVVETKSLTRAARELSLPRATLGRRLSRLEHRLGVRLLRRTTRSVTVTDAGEQLYVHAQTALVAVHAAQASVRHIDDGVLRGPVRVSVPPGLGADFANFINTFAAQHPQVRLQVFATSDLTDLVRDGYDVALRASAESTAGVVTRRLFRDERIAVASPRYIEAHGAPRSRTDLARHRCLMSFARGQVPQTTWPLIGGGQIHLEGALHANELQFVYAACLAGLGIALLPRLVMNGDLASGALVHVLPKVVGAESSVVVAFPEREFTPPQVRAFIDALVAWVPKMRVQRSP